MRDRVLVQTRHFTLGVISGISVSELNSESADFIKYSEMDSQGRSVIVCDNGTGVSIFL